MMAMRNLAFAFIALFVVFAVLGWARRRRRGRSLIRAGYGTDMIYWFVTPLTHRLSEVVLAVFVVVPVALLVWGRVDTQLVAQGFGPLARLPLALQTVLIVVLGDFVGYWVHRAFHRRRLWRFHAIHHSSTELDWLSAVRVHPVNEVVMRLAGAAAVLPLGLAPKALAVVAPGLTLLAILVHADLTWDWGPLRTVIASPRFHRWHHTGEKAARDKNFAGLLPLWDILFGTYYMPKGECPRSFGTDTPVAAGVLGQMVFPWREAAK